MSFLWVSWRGTSPNCCTGTCCKRTGRSVSVRKCLVWKSFSGVFGTCIMQLFVAGWISKCYDGDRLVECEGGLIQWVCNCNEDTKWGVYFHDCTRKNHNYDNTSRQINKTGNCVLICKNQVMIMNILAMIANDKKKHVSFPLVFWGTKKTRTLQEW